MKFVGGCEGPRVDVNVGADGSFVEFVSGDVSNCCEFKEESFAFIPLFSPPEILVPEPDLPLPRPLRLLVCEGEFASLLAAIPAE